MEKKRKLSLERKHNLTGWAFLLPAAILIFVFCFYPMIQALMLSFKNGMGDSVRWVGFANYVRILKDKTFLQCLFNTVFYFIIQVPVMLIIALVLAQLLNNPNIKGKGIYRTMIFLPCATSLVSYSMIFKSLFAQDGKSRYFCDWTSDRRLVSECMGCKICNYNRVGLEMDRLQYGVLSCRAAEY